MMPHYPEAYLESKHCKIFAHWRTPKGVCFCAYLQSLSQAFGMSRYAAAQCSGAVWHILKPTLGCFRSGVILRQRTHRIGNTNAKGGGTGAAGRVDGLPRSAAVQRWNCCGGARASLAARCQHAARDGVAEAADPAGELCTGPWLDGCHGELLHAACQLSSVMSLRMASHLFALEQGIL